MSDIPIVMIDDTPAKQKWFLAIVAWLNSRGMQNYTFTPLWPDPEKATTQSVDAVELLNVLAREDAIYLVDLKLNETAEQAAAFRVSLEKSGNDRLVRAVRQFTERRNPNPNRPAAPDPFKAVLQKYPIATLFLMAAKEKSRPTMFVSSLAEGDYASRVRDARLASVDHERFPHENAPEEMYPDPKAREAQLALWGNRILSLLDPFRRIRELTTNWFNTDATCDTGDYDLNALPHNLLGKALSNLPGHEACIRKVFDWWPKDLPWWRSENDAKALHEALKTFCGHHAGWMGHDPNDYSLSLAGAYLVFLMAVQARAPEHLPQYCKIDWSAFFNSSAVNPVAKEAHAFLPPQEHAPAEQAIRCLYNFFLSIIVRTDNGVFGIGEFKPPSKGAPAFCLRLEWAEEDVALFCRSVNARVAHSFSNDPNALALPPGKAPGAFLRFLIASQASSCGVGAPGVIRLSCNPQHRDNDRRWLIVGSSSYDHQ